MSKKPDYCTSIMRSDYDGGIAMIKRYCDCCEAEILKYNQVDNKNHRLTAEIRKSNNTLFKVEVITALDTKWNKGDFCKYCIIDAINKADDRPRKA